MCRLNQIDRFKSSVSNICLQYLITHFNYITKFVYQSIYGNLPTTSTKDSHLRSKRKVLSYKVICIPLACIDCLSPFKFLGIKVDTNKDCIGVRDFIICLIYDIEQIGQPLNVRNLVR